MLWVFFLDISAPNCRAENCPELPGLLLQGIILQEKIVICSFFFHYWYFYSKGKNTTTYTVVDYERIAVLEGDVIGW